MKPAPIWIVDDDRGVRVVLGAALRDAGHEVREFIDADALLAALADGQPAIVFTDVRMGGRSGLDLLASLREQAPEVAVIVMSAFTDVATTAAAFRQGAFDYLAKPFDLDAAVAMAGRALAHARPAPAGELVAPSTTQELIGSSAPMRDLFRSIGRVAASGMNVLIIGETGTGKELVARALHAESRRATQPFIALNTAAIPADLLESELFGHEAGAFTGAQRRHAGRFEQADHGTLFLDEIGDMPLPLQTRLLRVLAAGEFYRVGGRELIRADVRVIAATHQDLEAKVERGEFRADLLHRLDVLRLEVPALRERRDDIATLADHFLARASRDAGLDSKRFTPAAHAALRERAWPGNVRELENLCRRLAVLASGRRIGVEDLPAAGSRAQAAPDWTAALAAWAEAELRQAPSGTLHARALTAFEHTLFEVALREHGGHRQHAAQALGLGRNTLTRKLGPSRARRKT